MTSSVSLVEVGPRDGFQAVKHQIPTAQKIAAVRALASAGFDRIEVGAFVSPRALPQMADTADVWSAFSLQPTFRGSALVPNAQGAKNAVAAGFSELVFVLSASDSHNISNVQRPTEDSQRELPSIVASLPEGPSFLRVNIATAFDCPFEGSIPVSRVVDLVGQISDVRRQIEFGICDTTGRANPAHVRLLFDQLKQAVTRDGVTWAFHGHDTYGLGIANALYAYEAGVRVFDGSFAGLGGCPFAPGSSGNTASEDLVFAFEGMGVATGIDMSTLLDASSIGQKIDPASTGGHLWRVPRSKALSTGASFD